MKRVASLLVLSLLLIFGLLLGSIGFSSLDKPPAPNQPVTWSADAKWIGTTKPTYRLYARKTFYVGTDKVQSAWLRISADNDFVVFINGQQIAREISVLRNSVGLVSRLSVQQRPTDEVPYSVPATTEFLFQSAKDWKFTSYLDLSRYLIPGKNLIAINIQKGDKQPRFVLEGAIQSAPGFQSVQLTTGKTLWKVSILSENRQGLRWFHPSFPDQEWDQAKVLGPVRETTYSRLNQKIFEHPLQGSWISGAESKLGEAWLRKDWQIPHDRHRSYIRFSGNSEYDLLINGSLVGHYSADEITHALDVSNFLHTGTNLIAVHAQRFPDSTLSLRQSEPIAFFLDGWVDSARAIYSKPSETVKDDVRSYLEPTEPGDTKVDEEIAEDELHVKTAPHDSSDADFYDRESNLNENYPVDHSTEDETDDEFEQPDGLGAVRRVRLSDRAIFAEGMTAGIATDQSWIALANPDENWFLGAGQGQSTVLLQSNPPNSRLRFEGDGYLRNFPAQFSRLLLWQTGGMISAIAIAYALGFFYSKTYDSGWNTLGTGAALLFPGILFLISVELLKHRYAETEIALLFNQSQSNLLVVLQLVGVVLITLILDQGHRINQPVSLISLPKKALCFFWGIASWISLSLALKLFNVHLSFLAIFFLASLLMIFPNLAKSLVIACDHLWLFAKKSEWSVWIVLAGIVFVGLALRIYDIGFVDLEADENTSYDAIRGILRTGVPEVTSKIWYTRGPGYHYLCALWLRLVGDTAENARLLSALFGTATLVVTFIFARKITGNAWMSLLITAILAIDPWELGNSRFIRFYQVLQFTYILSLWLFFKGFIDRAGRRYQYAFFVTVTFAMLNQELTITTLPLCFLLGGLFFYRPFHWRKDWSILVGSITSLTIIVYDILFFSIKCLTPWVVLSGSTDSYIKPHLLDVTTFTNLFFAGPSRMHTLYTFFFVLGFLYFLIRGSSKLIFLFTHVVLSLIVLTIMTFQIAPRYTYNLYPIFVMLAVYSAFCVLDQIGKQLKTLTNYPLALRAIASICVLLLLFSNIEPIRVIEGYQNASWKRNTEATIFVRDHLQPGDIVVSASPFPAAIVLGKLDYYLMPAFRPGQLALPFDTVYLREGRLIERWAGGVVVNNLDQMSRILERANRVWVLIDDGKFDGKFVDPEFATYFETLGKVAMETFGCRVRLWERSDGILLRSPNQGGNLGIY